MSNETAKCNDQPASERSCPDPAGSDPIVHSIIPNEFLARQDLANHNNY